MTTKSESDTHNWKQDFKLENGNYQCQCRECDVIFIGHKMRTVCKVCSNNAIHIFLKTLPQSEEDQ